MRHFYIFLFITLFIKGYSQNRFAYKGRSDKKNEISLHFYSMWNNDYLATGIGYERTIWKYKNHLNSFISWQNTFLIRADNFTEHFQPFSASTNQFQSFVKYNLGYKKIFSSGLGLIIDGKKFYFNPAAMLSYKYTFTKVKITIGCHLQASLYKGIPLSQFNGTTIPTSLANPQKQDFSLKENWSGGIFIGKYF